MELLDSHAHYNDEKFDEDRKLIIESIYNSGVTTIINAGYSLESSKKAIEIANNYNFMYATVGVSPNDIENLPFDYIEKLKNMARQKKVVAIGEIGLDYYWNKENKDKQQEIFIKQIELANEMNLPIVIHTREAIMDTIDTLKNQIICKNKGVFHCCPLNVELVREALKLGFYMSFAGFPVAGATLPVTACLLLGIYSGNAIVICASIIFGIGHIRIHLMHRKEIVQKNTR